MGFYILKQKTEGRLYDITITFFGRFHIGELAVDAPLRFPVQSERSKVHANVSRYDIILHPYDDNDPKVSIIR